MKKINTMKKLSLIILIIVTLFGYSTYAHSDDLSPNLTKGKWLNKSDGYKLSANSDKTVERYKTITFGVDQTFVLDSVKLKYSGKWRFIGNDIYLEFNDSNIKTKIANIENDKLIIGKDSYNSYSGAFAGLINFYEFTGVPNATPGHIIMVLVGIFFIFLAIRYNYEPLLLIPIGIGIIIGNIPFYQAEGFNLQLGIYEEGSVMSYLYFGVRQGIYPPLIFLGIGAMTDFSSLISNPKLMILGAAAQVGIFLTFLGALVLGFGPAEAGAIGIIGGADGPTAIFLSSKLAPHLIGPIAIAAYSYMALVPIIQPPFMRLLITKKERLIRMKPPRSVSKLEKIMFPIVGLLLTAYISPSAARTSLIDIVTILLGITVGASTQADVFLTSQSMWIFGLGALSFIIATCGGLLFAKLMNVFLKGDNKINPLIGAAGVSAVPDSARVVQLNACYGT